MSDRIKYSNAAAIDVAADSSVVAMSVPRVSGLSTAYFVRCQFTGPEGSLLAQNAYWESITDDDLGSPSNDDQFTTKLEKWADLTSLDHMPPVNPKASGSLSRSAEEQTATITLANNSNHIAFFVRVELTRGRDGEEILPITYDDNYVTLFPHESRVITAKFQLTQLGGGSAALRIEGYNVPKQLLSLKTGMRRK